MHTPQWSARCDCRNDHNSSSGRCNARDVTDPHAVPGGAVLCELCRLHCTAHVYGTGSSNPYPTERGGRERRR